MIVSIPPTSFPPFISYNRRLHQTKFTTGDDNHVGDDYFLTSGDKIRYFLEEDAVDANGKLMRDKSKAVNKIGHGEYY
jgi:hypothetical protein